jgi:hypothetical protein
LDIIRLGRVAAHLQLDLGAAAATRGRECLKMLAGAHFASDMSELLHVSQRDSHCEFQRLQECAVYEGIIRWSEQEWIFLDRISRTNGYSPTTDVPDCCQYVASVANAHASIIAAVAKDFGLSSLRYMLGNHSGRLTAGDAAAYAVFDRVDLAHGSVQLEFADLRMDQVKTLLETIRQHPRAVICVVTLDRLSMAEPEISNVFDAMAANDCYFHAAGLGLAAPLRVPEEWRTNHQFMVISALVVRFRAVRSNLATFTSRGHATSQAAPSYYHTAGPLTETTIAGSPEALCAAKASATVAESTTSITALLAPDLSQDQLAKLATECNLISQANTQRVRTNTSSKKTLRYILSVDGENERRVGLKNICAKLAAGDAASGTAAGLPSAPERTLSW